MKTSIKTLFAAAFATILMTGTAFATDSKETQAVTVLNDVKNINKIKVSGNVELILIQSTKESVKVYNNYYGKNAFVQQSNGDLYISSFDKERLTVIAYVNNLTELSATDNAFVTTDGQFNTLSLDVKLQSNASADLNINAIALNSKISGSSSLKLKGYAEGLTLGLEQTAQLKMDQFKSDATNVVSKNKVIAKTYSSNLEQLGE